jgi:glycosyltransferase involved in cell wall biosynthesis
MFGWEFPPNISGGLGTACLGITNALSVYPDIELTFVVPKAYGNEPADRMKLIGANEIDLITSKINVERLCGPYTFLSIQSGILPYIDPEDFKRVCELNVKSGNPETNTPLTSVEFTGKYGSDLMTEIHNFSIVAEYIAKQGNYDIIHAHDWLTFPAGILAKKITGKPLIVHVHATDFDRSGGSANPHVYEIEKAGMDGADAIIAVSDLTSQIIKEKYRIDPSKIFTVHNGVEPFKPIKGRRITTKKKKHTVTFLGRITLQKGPRFFIEVAQKVLTRMKNVKFVMAGSGDLQKPMEDLVSQLGISDKFLFPGFLKGEEVDQILGISDVYIMPSVSEPFGISPLEAMHFKVPVIISKQSGVSEVIQHAIKLDFWDTDAMADTVYSILNRPALKKMMKDKGAIEVRKISWKKTAVKITRIYDQYSSA